MNKIALKDSLVTLGTVRPDLRPAIRPILAALSPKVAAANTAADLLGLAVKSMGGLKITGYKSKITKNKIKNTPKPEVKSEAEGQIEVKNGDFLFEISYQVVLEADESGKGAITVNAQDLTGEGSTGKAVVKFTKGAQDVSKAAKTAIEDAISSVVSKEMSLI